MKKQPNNTAIVFGATGFVGSYLIRALLKDDWQVFAVTRGPKRFIIPFSIRGLQWVKWNEIMNILKAETYENHRSIFIFHLAANISVSESFNEPEKFIRENVYLTLKVAEFLKYLRYQARVIYLSSDRVYGNSNGIVTEADHPQPIDAYGLSKYIGEEILRIISLLHPLKVIIVRASNLYGPFQQSKQFIPSLFYSFWKGSNELEVGNLSSKRNFLFIDDLVRGLILISAYTSSRSFEVFNLANRSYPLKEVTSSFKYIAKKKLGREIHFSTNKTLFRSIKSELGDFEMTTKKAERELNWQPIISLNEGIETIFNQEGKLYA